MFPLLLTLLMTMTSRSRFLDFPHLFVQRLQRRSVRSSVASGHGPSVFRLRAEFPSERIKVPSHVERLQLHDLTLVAAVEHLLLSTLVQLVYAQGSRRLFLFWFTLLRWFRIIAKLDRFSRRLIQASNRGRNFICISAFLHF